MAGGNGNASGRAEASDSKEGLSKLAGSSSSSSKDKATQRRMQGVSCDACKFRKVKCDRRAKVEKKIAEAEASGEVLGEDVEVSCSVCTSHGLRCTFTQAEPKKRRGRRIVEIQAHQRRESSNLPPLPSATDGAALGGTGAGTGMAEDAAASATSPAGPSRQRHMSSYPSPMSTPSTPLGLFSIPGLTRSLLDACVLAYFKYCSPTVAILHADVFAARYAKYFELYAGTRAPNPTTDPSLAALPPLTELLILAVACAGSSLLLPPITGTNPQAKFKLQQRLSQRCDEILRHVSWTQRLREEGADLIEAVYVLVDPTFLPVNEDGSAGLLGVSSDPLTVLPTSHEALVRLTFALSIHRRPKAEYVAGTAERRWRTGAGELIDDREVFRRVRCFWNVFIQDTFRSFSARRSPLVNDEAYDQDAPRWAPRQDGDFSASFGLPAQPLNTSAEHAAGTLFSPQTRAPIPGAGSAGDPSPASAAPQPARFSRYDALWLEAILRLCFITRTVGARSVSPRAQGRGVLTSDMEHAMSAFAAWQAQLPAELAWETQVGDALPLAGEFEPRGELSSIAFRNSLKSVFLETLFHGQILGCWAAVKDYGLRTDADIAQATSLLSTQLNMHNSSPHSTDRRSSSADPDAGPSTTALAHLTQPPAPPEVELRVRSRLEGVVTTSFLRVALISRQAASFGILRASRVVLRDIPCSFAMWGCGLAADMVENKTAPRSGLPISFEQVLEAVTSLAEAVESVDSAIDTPEMTRGLRDMIAKFPGGKDLLNRHSRHKRDSTTSSAGVNDARSTAASTSQASSTPSPSAPPSGAGTASHATDFCNPHGLFGPSYGVPRQSNPVFTAPSHRVDDIAALSSNADALYDGAGAFGASELLDAQWLEQLAAAVPVTSHAASSSTTSTHAPLASTSGPSAAHVPFHGGQTDSYRLQHQQPPSQAQAQMPTYGGLGDARDYAANAWELPVIVDEAGQPALPQQGAMDWLWGGTSGGAAH